MTITNNLIRESVSLYVFSLLESALCEQIVERNCATYDLFSERNSRCITLQLEKITYINVCFRNEFPEKNTCQLHRNMLLDENFPEITLHVFVCDLDNYM